MLQTIVQLPLRLNSLELLNTAACKALAAYTGVTLADSAYLLMARVEGTPAVTQSQAQRLTAALQRLPLTRPPSIYTWRAAEQERFWSALGALARGELSRDASSPETIVVKVSLIMSALPAFCQEVQEIATQAGSAWEIIAHAGSGIVYISIP